MKNNIMLQYIQQQKQILTNLIESNQFEIFKNKNYSEIHIIGTGSSFHSALASLPAFKENTYVHKPLDFFKPELNSLIIFISQTGTSKNVYDAIEKYSSFETLAITADINSPIAKKCNYAIDIQVGEELCNAKTKGVSATIVTLGCLAHVLSKNESTSLSSLKNDIDKIDDIIEKTLSTFDAALFSKTTHFIIIAPANERGIGLEATLKMMEVTLIPTIYSDLDEFSHGYHRIVNNHSCLIVFNQPIPEIKQLAQKVDCPVIFVDESPLLNLIVIQTVIAKLAESMDVDPNQPIYKDFVSAMDTRL